MRKNRQTIWFLIGFAAYGIVSIGVGLIWSIPGSFPFAALCFFGVLCCSLLLLLSKAGL